MRRARKFILPALALALVGTALVSLGVGAVPIPFHDVLAALAGDRSHPVLWALRVPRVLLGLMVGASLAVAGALMQGLFRNPLADPALIGASSGGALGAVFILVLGERIFPTVSWVGDQSLLPFAAFAGALAVTWMVRRIASAGGYTAVATLLLVGVAVNSLAGAVIGFATFMANDAQLRSLTFWTLGALGSASWPVVGMVAPFCLALIVLAPIWGGVLNAISLGEAEAGHLGFDVEKTKTLLLVLTAAGVGASVAFTGIILFVGLVVPHMARALVGPDHRWLIPASGLLGGLLLVAADTAARTLVAPAELPIGVLTAACGAPFFLFMLLGQRRKALWQ